MKKPNLGRAGARSDADTANTPGRNTQRSIAVARGVALAPVRVARVPARAAVSVGRYWRAERTTLRQGFAALSISSVGDLLAGLALASMTGSLQALPGLIILIPAAIGMRGAIFGALGSRLGTAVHAGLFKVTWDRKGVLWQNAYAATLLSVLMSAFLAAAARMVGAISGHASMSIWDFMTISVLAGIASGAVILVMTVVLARVASARDWDLDSVAAPIVTFLGDIVTLPSLYVASLFATRGNTTLIIGVALAALSVYCLVMALRAKLPIARRILRESMVMLALAGIVNLIAGLIARREEARFQGFPALLILIPPFLEDAGALGSLVSARLTSKLHLGSIRPRPIPEKLAWLDISLAAPFALSVFTLVGISADIVASVTGHPSPGLGRMVQISLIAGGITTLGAALISYGGAVATYRFGLDPDNHGTPIVTSAMDLIGMMALVGTVVHLGVG